jgi:hypothetical protein
MARYFAMKPPQTLEKLLQKIDEYIWVDNDFWQRRKEAYWYSEMTRGFGGRLHPRHVRTIHNPSSSNNRGNHTQGHQQSSQSSGDATKFLQATSSKRQRRKKLQRKVQFPTQKIVLFILWGG